MPRTVLMDPLQFLPVSVVIECRKGQTIYGHDRPSTRIYLVIEGKVKICRLSDQGRQVVLDVYQRDEFFGESAFVGRAQGTEHAVALENTKLMAWSISDIEAILTLRPQLAIAFLQLFAKRSNDCCTRIESFSVENIERRLARALIVFAERLGTRSEDGSVRMIPFTHELLSRYVGTSREIVTHYMNVFRRDGYLHYSRQGIFLIGDKMKDAILAVPIVEDDGTRKSKAAKA